MSSERGEVRERVRHAIAGPVAESDKLLAELRDADAKTSLREQPPAETTVASPPSAESEEPPSQVS
jgi:hypothetical protein